MKEKRGLVHNRSTIAWLSVLTGLVLQGTVTAQLSPVLGTVNQPLVLKNTLLNATPQQPVTGFELDSVLYDAAQDLYSYNPGGTAGRISLQYARTGNPTIAEVPVARWALDGRSEVEDVAEGDREANDGTLEGNASIEWDAVRGRVLALNGPTDYVKVTTANEITTAISNRTISLWFKPNKVTGRQVLYSEGGNGNGFIIYLEDSALKAGVWNTKNKWLDGFITLNKRISTGKWVHMALRLKDGQTDQGKLQGYFGGNLSDPIEGQEVKSSNEDITIGARTDKSRFVTNGLGVANSDGNRYAFNGMISDVRVYNTALTGRDLKNLAGASVEISQINAVISQDINSVAVRGWDTILKKNSTNDVESISLAKDSKNRAFGSLAAFGPNTQVLAVYQRDFALAEPAVAHSSIGKKINKDTLGERFGPFMTVSTLGNGRVLTMATIEWFNAHQWGDNDTVFANNALGWLTAGMTSGDKKILVTNPNFFNKLTAISATKGDHIPPSKKIIQTSGTVTTMSDSAFVAELAAVDVFMGSLDDLSSGKINALADFALSGKSLLIGSVGHTRIYENRKSPYVNHPDTVYFSGKSDNVANLDDEVLHHKGDRVHMDNVNQLLRLAGTGVGCYPFPGNSKKINKIFTREIATQWNSEYGSLDEAVDALIGQGGPLVFEKKLKTAEAELLAKANLFASQLVTLTMALPLGDPLRSELDAQLDKLKAVEGSIIQDPVRMALLMHEAENNFRYVYRGLIDQIEPSTYGLAVDEGLNTLVNERFELRWDRYRIQPLGLYAAPGDTVTLDFSEAPEMIKKGFSVRIGQYNHSEFASIVAWNRSPILQLAVPINSETVIISSAYGGDLYIDYNSDSLPDFGRYSGKGHISDNHGYVRLPTGFIKRHHKMSGAKQFVTVNEAYESCTFVLGKDTVEDWNNRIKYLPGRVVNLVGNHSIMTVDKSVYLGRNDLIEPEWMLLAADRMGFEQARLAGTEHQFAFGYVYESGSSWNQQKSARGYGVHHNPTSRADHLAKQTMEGLVGGGQNSRRHEGDHEWGSQIARLMSSNGEIDAYFWEQMVNYASGRISLDQVSSYYVSDEFVSRDENGVPELDDDGVVVTNRVTDKPSFSIFSTKASFEAAEALLTEAVREKFTFPYYDLQGQTRKPFQVHQSGQQNLVFWLTLANSQFGDQTGWDVMWKALPDRATSRWQSDMGSPDFDLPQWLQDNKEAKAEGFAINWAAASGYDISKYLQDMLGFTITGDATNAINAYTEGKNVWLPLGSEYMTHVVHVQENSSGHVLNLVENTVALGLDRKLFNPKVQVASTNTEHGVITQTANVWTYTPTSGYSGFDSFTYTASHGAGWGQPEETFTVNLFVVPTPEALDISSDGKIAKIIEKYGHGASVEEWAGMWEGEAELEITEDDEEEEEELVNPINSKLTEEEKKAEERETLVRHTEIRDNLHNETMLIPADRVYKTPGGMASLSSRSTGRPKRMRAYFRAPKGGAYRFYGESQGGRGLVQVWLNTQGPNRDGATKIVSSTETQTPHRWSKNAASDPIDLEAGKLYYMEIVTSQAEAVSVGMSYGTNTVIDASIPVDLNEVVDVIPNKYLIPYIAPRSIRAIDDVVTVAGGGTYTIDVMANDKYFTKGTIDTGRYLGNQTNDLSKVKLVYASEARQGTVSIVNNQLLYTPKAGFSGTDRIAYLVQHTLHERARKGTVTITIGAAGTPIVGPVQPAVNTEPVANPDYQISASSQPIFINVLANDVDADGDKLTLLSVTDPDQGSVKIHLDGEKIMYTPEAGGLQGAETNSFSYTITDSRGGTNTAKVTLISVDRAVSTKKLPWLETFNRIDITGFQDTGDTAWVLDDSRVEDGAQKGYGLVKRMLRLTGTHTGDTNRFVEWRSTYIDVSTYSGISISVDAKSAGMGTRGWLKLMYRLDDDMTLHTFDYVTGAINDNAAEFTTFTTTNNIAGNQIQVVIQGSTRRSGYLVDNIKVDGNIPPQARAGTNIAKTDSDGNGSETVRLKGSKSTDSDGTIVSYVWKVDGVRVATGIKADYDAPVGSTTITLIVTDNDGAKDTDRVIVTVNEPAIVDVLAGIVYAPDGVDVGGTNGLSVVSSKLINEQSITNMTWSLWFRAASLTNRQMLYEQGGGQRGANIYLDEKQVYMGIWGMEGDIDAYLMAGSVSTGSWNHAVLVLDGDTVSAYLNGAKTGPKIGSILGSHRNPIGIGHVNNKTSMHDDDKGFHGSHTFNGQIDELRIYNRSLTTNEVSRVYEFK